jgi:hypothetical protein
MRKVEVLIVLAALAGCSLPLPTVASIDDTERWIVDNIAPMTDLAAWGKADYWQSPEQTLDLRHGDCDDRAILFAWIIHNELKIPADSILFVKVSFPFPSHAEAHLLVRVDGRDYLGGGTYQEIAITSYVDGMWKALHSH